MELPTIDRKLIEALEKQNPLRLPNPADSERSVWMEVGKQRLIQMLRLEHDRQEQERSKHSVFLENS